VPPKSEQRVNTQKTIDTITTKAKTSISKKTILFFGNSLTAAYGLETTAGFPAIIKNRIDSLQLPYHVINSGLSGETTAGGLRRLNWVLKQKIDVFVLELGANDGLRGTELTETYANLEKIIKIVKNKNPNVEIILAGMQIPPNMGVAYANTFKEIYPKLADAYDLELIPFLLEDVAGEASLNLPDGIHPNIEGQKILAENVWDVLEGILVM